MGRLTTHILDTALGRPAAGVRLELYRLDGDAAGSVVATAVTNQDGRCDAPLLEGESFSQGQYQLVFHAGAYFDALGIDLPDPKFLDEVVIRFGISDVDQHYHVPILLSPFAYSTYRGS